MQASDGLPSKAIIASAQGSGKAGQAPILYPERDTEALTAITSGD